jgi:hypothetical protein
MVDPVKHQHFIRAEIQRQAIAAGARMADPRGRASERRVVVGVAEYVRDEVVALDMLLEALRMGRLGASLEVFLLSQCASQNEIERLIPGVTPVFQSPVVGVWEGGQIVTSGSGREALNVIGEIVRRG